MGGSCKPPQTTVPNLLSRTAVPTDAHPVLPTAQASGPLLVRLEKREWRLYCPLVVHFCQFLLTPSPSARPAKPKYNARQGNNTHFDVKGSLGSGWQTWHCGIQYLYFPKPGVNPVCFHQDCPNKNLHGWALVRTWMKVKEESEKVGLKLSIQKLKIMASGPITSWEIDGETVETLSDFILGGSKITADGDCSHEIKRCLLLGRKVMTNLDGIFKSRDITLSTKVRLVKAMVFPVVMYGCESWNIKKAECRRIDAFELQFWRRLLRVPWTARRSNQSILKEISPGCSLEGLMLKLKLQYFGHLM